MKKLLSTLPLIAIGFTCILYSCCKKEEPCKQRVTSIEISAEDRAKWAYTGYETLTFIRHPAGDTHSFVGEGIDEYNFEVLQRGIECPAKYIKEGRSILFTSLTLNTLINKITVKMENDPLEDNSHSSLFVIHPKQMFETLPLDIKLTTKDSMLINGKWYPNVSKFSAIGHPVPNTYWCYYSPTEGIVQFEFVDGESWRLLK